MKKIVVLIVAGIIIFFSCRKENKSTLIPIDFSYSPLEVGKEWNYIVTYIKIDVPISFYDTQRYYLKEKIESTFYDETGNLLYRIERYKRDDTLSEWQLTDVWMAQYYKNQYHKVEENIRYVKLVFPVKNNLKWNGNAMNTLEPKYYTIDSIHKPWKMFDSTLVVVHENTESLIDKYLTYEKYAINVGLVEYRSINISQAFVNYNLPIEQRIIRGEMYIQTILQ